MQEAFLAVWNRRTTYRAQRGTVAVWLLTIVRHRAIDSVRRNRRHDSRRADDHLLDFFPSAGDVLDQISARADGQHLRSQLAQLPDEQQEVIALAFYGQLSHSEIAAHLGLPAGTVKGRMRLGLGKLRTSFDPG